jgi:hypothetical protein
MSVKVSGINGILKNLNKEIEQIEGNTRKGLSKVGLFVKAEAVERAPVEFGTLRNSAFSQVSPNTFRGYPVATIGFTAKYAPYVHEAPMKLKGQPRAKRTGVYWQGGENKFLEKAVKLNIPKILDIIKTESSKSLR